MAAELLQHLPEAIQQLPSVMEQATNILQGSAYQLFATAALVIGCMKVRYGKNVAVHLVRGSSLPEGAEMVASKNPGADLGTEASGTIKRVHNCDASELDADGWPYSVEYTGEPRILPVDYIS